MESKRSKKLLMLLGGVKKEFRGKGLDVLMALKCWSPVLKVKWNGSTFIWSLKTTYKMRAECERIGGKVIKKFRIYQKDL